MLNTKFSSWPLFTYEEAEAISKVLLSNKVNYWTGSECREFEKEFASWSDAKYAVALGNGTLALDAALKALNMDDGDEVIVTSRTFIASISSIVNSGATPIFADVDLSSQNIKQFFFLKKIAKKRKLRLIEISKIIKKIKKNSVSLGGEFKEKNLLYRKYI